MSGKPWQMRTTPLASYAAQLICTVSASSTLPSDNRNHTKLENTHSILQSPSYSLKAVCFARNTTAIPA